MGGGNSKIENQLDSFKYSNAQPDFEQRIISFISFSLSLCVCVCVTRDKRERGV